MLKMFAIAVGAAMLVLAPGVANAQADESGMLCVYDATTKDYESIAEAFLYGDGGDATDAVLDTAAQKCADDFGFSEDASGAARDLAVYGAAIDYLTETLMLMGVSDEAVDGVFTVYNALGSDDVDLFYDTEWRDDANFLARLKAELLKTGFPDETEELATAYDILEISALVDDAILSFSFADDN